VRPGDDHDLAQARLANARQDVGQEQVLLRRSEAGCGAGGEHHRRDAHPQPSSTVTRSITTGFEAPGTAGSQFFVVTGADVGLPAEYAIVGKITDGIESVTAIDRLGIQDGPPSKPVVIERVTVEEG